MFEFVAREEKAQIHLAQTISRQAQCTAESENHVELSELGAALAEDGGVGE